MTDPTKPSTAMNPTTHSSSRLTINPPFPANFDHWPKPMQERYRKHALSQIKIR